LHCPHGKPLIASCMLCEIDTLRAQLAAEHESLIGTTDDLIKARAQLAAEKERADRAEGQLAAWEARREDIGACAGFVCAHLEKSSGDIARALTNILHHVALADPKGASSAVLSEHIFHVGTNRWDEDGIDPKVAPSNG
jgi:hypothetical protein